MSKLSSRQQWTGLAFCAPWILGMIVFMGYPLVAALYYSFCDYNVLLDPVFIGTENYTELFGDRLFWKSLGNTAVFAAGSVGLGLLSALVLALLLNSRVVGLSVYRTIFFLPTLMPVVAGTMLWMWLYNGDGGLINSLLMQIGISKPPTWLQSPFWSKPALIFMAAWGSGHTMVILLAGLQDVPRSLQEAAVIDGANIWQRMWNVTLPMISPVIYFNVVMGIIGGLQVFAQAFIISSDGAPENSLLFYVLRLFNVGFNDLRMGYASAMAFVLFVIILVLTLLTQKFSQKWVTYDR